MREYLDNILRFTLYYIEPCKPYLLFYRSNSAKASLQTIYTMKSGVPVLFPNEKTAERVTNYSERHSTPLPQYITDFHAKVVSSSERSEYLTSNFQSQCHVLLARMIGAKRGECALVNATVIPLRSKANNWTSARNWRVCGVLGHGVGSRRWARGEGDGAGV